MPRITDGQMPNSARRFKKRRAWLPIEVEGNENKSDNCLPDVQFPPDKQGYIDNKQITNREQTDNKQVTNKKQTDNKQITSYKDEIEPKTLYREQTDNKQITNREQTDNKIENLSKSSSAEILDNLLILSNQQQKLFLFILERCLENGGLTSGPIPSHIFSTLINATNNTVRTQVHRLISKNFLNRLPGKPGRGGFHSFSMTTKVLRAGIELKRRFWKNFSTENFKASNDIDNKQITNREQTDNTKANNPLPSSSSNLIKTTTTRDDDESKNFPEINFSALKEIGFKKYHLDQILKRTDLSKETIQESIDFFVFDLKENNKAEKLKTNPLNFIMGILIKGIPYSPPENYEDPKTKAFKEFVERKKAIRKKQEELERQAMEEAFEEWFNSQTKKDCLQLLPPIIRKRNSEPSEKIIKIHLYGHFKENIWPDIKQKI